MCNLTLSTFRIELGSKLKNLIVVNILKGHRLSVFISLDSDLAHLKQTLNVQYENPVYGHINTSAGLNKIIIDSLSDLLSNNSSILSNLDMHVKFNQRQNLEYSVQRSVPVHSRGNILAQKVFQNQMSWQVGLRECVRWVQAEEFSKRDFFDFVVRIRFE